MKYSKEFKEEALKLSGEIGLKKCYAKVQKYHMSDDEANRRHYRART